MLFLWEILSMPAENPIFVCVTIQQRQQPTNALKSCSTIDRVCDSSLIYDTGRFEHIFISVYGALLTTSHKSSQIPSRKCRKCSSCFSVGVGWAVTELDNFLITHIVRRHFPSIRCYFVSLWHLFAADGWRVRFATRWQHGSTRFLFSANVATHDEHLWTMAEGNRFRFLLQQNLNKATTTTTGNKFNFLFEAMIWIPQLGLRIA